MVDAAGALGVCPAAFAEIANQSRAVRGIHPHHMHHGDAIVVQPYPGEGKIRPWANRQAKHLGVKIVRWPPDRWCGWNSGRAVRCSCAFLLAPAWRCRPVGGARRHRAPPAFRRRLVVDGNARAVSGSSAPRAAASSIMVRRSLRTRSTSKVIGCGSPPARARAIEAPRVFSTFGPPELSANRSTSHAGSRPRCWHSVSASPKA